MSNKESIDPKFHPSFTEGDVCVIAKDGTHFAADCNRLARGSQTFKSLLELPRPTNGHELSKSADKKVEESKTFHIDATSTLTAYFLAFLGADIPLLPPTGLADTFKLLKLCDMFECTCEHTKLLQQRLQAETKGHVWKLLAIASHLNDRALGLQCLEKMDMNSFKHGRAPEESRGGDFAKKMIALSYDWQGRLYSLVFQDKEQVIAQRAHPIYRMSRKHHKVLDRYEVQPTEITAMTFKNDWSRLCRTFGDDNFWSSGGD
ncbi:uncharacterized protein I303_100787 [Kwoniella dejecticola CBS 10117]|uniref:BTB domain-containing protein n=1 Tax=Kwoniella dejecticola CBS 10117 TaxID=1296121 RepID=A0A1A6AFZ0_9TREE|nr:uncharacterized protein I303_00789 [Kwoniella dejecticola CBS 10117]OBR88969.1 hypothetical protein I303_00789 [Kwoniella dejecticola CBS 10117]